MTAVGDLWAGDAGRLRAGWQSVALVPADSLGGQTSMGA